MKKLDEANMFTYATVSFGEGSHPAEGNVTAADCLRRQAEIYERRNKKYKANYQRVGSLLAVLFPNGVTAEQLGRAEFHLLMLKLVKLTRFVATDMKHLDSIRDDGVYCAMIEAILLNREQGE